MIVNGDGFAVGKIYSKKFMVFVFELQCQREYKTLCKTIFF